jgi:hypothetical protein
VKVDRRRGRGIGSSGQAGRTHFFGKIFNESLDIQLGLPVLLDASTADAKCSRLLKFLS